MISADVLLGSEGISLEGPMGFKPIMGPSTTIGINTSDLADDKTLYAHEYVSYSILCHSNFATNTLYCVILVPRSILILYIEILGCD